MSGSSAHRIWRLAFTSTAGNAYAMAEVQFRTAVGSPLLFGGGTATAAETYGGVPGSYDPSKAADNDPSTLWSANDNAAGQWWQYDYGAGNGLAIVEVVITPRNDGYADQAPSAFDIEWSDDGETFTSVGSFTAQPWTAGVAQTFDVVAASGANPRFWRLSLTGTAGNAYALAEVQFRETAGTPQLFAIPASASAYLTWNQATSSNGEPQHAADNNEATFWTSNDNSAGQWWQYDYGANGIVVAEVAISTRNDNFYNQAPASFDLMSSFDGQSWTKVASYVAKAWAVGTTQTFPDEAPKTGASSFVSIMA